ncbi:NADP-dependent mannitol dehydrogenase [Lachnellula suecica]|uniref:NADP-dependent mannitol dehydrogenase n=1 Tax=Lachnellula suecica TaxID=602035 RepID=A0A8T9BY81_9HELO|nr:NADP-dependent mannitol dehydrogenase [Lachnellula suecica]
MAPPTETPRDALTCRVLPQMVLSTGDASSKTAPPAPAPSSLDVAGRAKLRFEVRGNAIVTGGAGTLGFEAARALLEHGLSGLMIFDVIPAQASAKIAELQLEFPSAKIAFRQVDITDDVAVANGVEETASLFGSVDVLLCFAGVVGCQHALEMSAAQWRKTLDINTTGSFLVAQAVAKQMVTQSTGGSIVFTASISGHRVNYPQPQIAYNVSKAALLTLKSGLAAEWARYGIRVNSISPGYADTILNEGDGIAACRQVWAERNPLGRMAAPSELTGAVVLLASSAGTYMNGADIVVDGGQTLF